MRDAFKNVNKVTLTLERISLFYDKKRPATRHNDHDEIEDVVKQISSFNKERAQQTTISEILQICQRIKNMDFEFPPQKIILLHDIISEKLKQAVDFDKQNALETMS